MQGNSPHPMSIAVGDNAIYSYKKFLYHPLETTGNY
jgi:hypothetical protein